MVYHWNSLPIIAPFNGQLCWVRALENELIPFEAVWDSANESFVSVTTGLMYPKYYISRWKELSNSGDKVWSFISRQTPLNPLRLDINGLKHFYYSISWGDGEVDAGYFTGEIISFTHSYQSTGDKNVTITMPSASLTYIYSDNEPLYGSLPDISDFIYFTNFQLSRCKLSGSFFSALPLPLLSTLFIQSNTLAGPLCSLSELLDLTELNVRQQAFNGNFPDISALVKLTRLTIDTNSFTGSLPDIASLPLISVFRTAGNLFNSPFPDISQCTQLSNFWVDSNTLPGSIPDLSLLTLLSSFQAAACSITGYTASTLALSITTFSLFNNALPSAAVNQILADFVVNLASRPAVGTLTLNGGTNGAPTGQGIIDKAAIQAHGWTVYTN